MRKLKDLVGQRFGRLHPIKYLGTQSMWGGRHGVWLCVCDCGGASKVASKQLKSGQTKSCGCLKRECGRANATHGESKKGRVSPEYNVWALMRRRCSNPNVHDFKNYGGRGICVCSRWQDSFEAFLSDMGRRPSPGHSIDRIDNDGNYEPGNCRWATRVEQAANRGISRFIEYRGQKFIAAEWGRRVGIPGRVISLRLRLGWSIDRAMTQPYKLAAK